MLHSRSWVRASLAIRSTLSFLFERWNLPGGAWAKHLNEGVGDGRWWSVMVGGLSNMERKSGIERKWTWYALGSETSGVSFASGSWNWQPHRANFSTPKSTHPCADEDRVPSPIAMISQRLHPPNPHPHPSEAQISSNLLGFEIISSNFAWATLAKTSFSSFASSQTFSCSSRWLICLPRQSG